MASAPVTVESARQAALAFVARTLEAAGVPFFVVPSYRGDAYRVGLLDAHRGRAVAALRSTASAGWKVRPRGPAQSTTAPLDRLPEVGDEPGYAVFRPRRWEKATFRLGPEAGVVLEFWRQSGSQWESRLVNPVACVLGAAGQRPAAVDVGGETYPTVEGLLATAWDDVDFPVDVVYTWVDGADPDWVRDRDARLAEIGAPVSEERAGEARFADHGELRYSLRSIEQFMPWVRTIHLVTADQRPDWLVQDHPRLRVVSHRDILDPDVLPTFNSMAIETALHHIDGLAEHYLYFNDDVFAGRPLRPRSFFLGNGGSKFFPRRRAQITPGPPSADDTLIVQIAKTSRDLLDAQFGRRISQLVLHTPHPQQRSVLAEIEERFATQVMETRQTPFRRADNVAMAGTLHHYYAYFTGRAVPGRLGYRPVALSLDGVREQLRLVARNHPQTFCLNDAAGGLDPGEKARLVRRFLERYFPEPSSFER